MIRPIPAIGDPNSPIIAGAGPRDVTVLVSPARYRVVRGKEELSRYRRQATAARIARELGGGFTVKVTR